MRVLFFSDTHYYLNPNRSITLPDGENSWLSEQIQITKSIFNKAIEHGVKMVVHCGDLFEEKNRIDTHLYNTVWELYKEYSSKFKIYLLKGNHDYSTNKDSALKPFSEFAEVVTHPIGEEIDGVLILLIPFGMVSSYLSNTYINHSLRKMSVLVTHEDYEDLQYSSGFKYTKPLKQEIVKNWTVVFNGHIHKNQHVKNIINVGSIMQNNFGEEGEKKFYYILDTVEGSVESYQIYGPKFITGLGKEVLDAAETDSYNFYRIDVDSGQIDNPIFKEHNVEYRLIKNKEREFRLKESNKKNEKEVLLDEMMQYIQITKTDLNKKNLIAVGKEIINE